MVNPAAVLGAPLHQPGGDHGDPSAQPGAYDAEITAVDGDTVSLIVPDYSARHDFQAVPYVSPAGTPSVGDACVVTFTDGKSPVAVVPGSGSLFVKKDQAPLHVYDFGVNGDGSDESLAFQAAIDAAQAAGRQLLAPGRYFVQNLTWAGDKPFILRGESGGLSSVSPFAGPTGVHSRLRRAASGQPILTGPSTGVGDFDIADIEFYGFAQPGKLLVTPSVNRWRMRNVHFRGAADTAWHLNELYNGSGTDIFFTDCGGGAIAPAWLFDATAGVGQPGAAINKFVNVTMIGSNSSIKMKRSGAGTGATTDIDILGLSIERYAGTFPFIELANQTQNVRIQGRILMGDGTGMTAAVVHDAGSGAGARANVLDLVVDRTQGPRGPDYVVQHKSGVILLPQIVATTGFVALFRIESSAAAGSFRHGPVAWLNEGIRPRYSDARSSGALGPVTGSRGGNAAVASALAQLAGQGLIVDQTT